MKAGKATIFKLCIFIVILLINTSNCHSINPLVYNEDVIYQIDTMPEFTGGQQNLFRYLRETVRYPVIAQQNGVQGRVMTQFIVDRNGKIENASVVWGEYRQN